MIENHIKESNIPILVYHSVCPLVHDIFLTFHLLPQGTNTLDCVMKSCMLYMYYDKVPPNYMYLYSCRERHVYIMAIVMFILWQLNAK